MWALSRRGTGSVPLRWGERGRSTGGTNGTTRVASVLVAVAPCRNERPLPSPTLGTDRRRKDQDVQDPCLRISSSEPNPKSGPERKRREPSTSTEDEDRRTGTVSRWTSARHERDRVLAHRTGRSPDRKVSPSEHFCSESSFSFLFGGGGSLGRRGSPASPIWKREG